MAVIKDFFGTDVDTESIKKPSDLYRLMRPEYFSDSHIEKEKIEREQFKYILSRLSTDMRQDAFEELTRRCVIKLITPNLTPQTGPTGGGDAKADFVTYPASEDVTRTWIVPEGGCKGDDVWAFAVSTKEKWSPKMDKDVKKIVERYPNCSRIYFCTNQAVSSRNRDQKQQKYKKEEWGGKETYILDQNWFLQAIYDQGCYNEAVEALGLGAGLNEKVVLGPRDIERKKRLDEIEAELPKILSDGVEDKYVEDLIIAAKLARELERPESEVTGRFAVALDAAKKYGFPQQVFECIYQKAWTDFYWYDKPDNTLEGYNELKELLLEDINVVRLEKIYNLYRLLVAASGQGLMRNPLNVLDEQVYYERLNESLVNNPQKPSCSLFLKICLLEDKLIEGLQSNQKTGDRNEALLNDTIAHLIEALKQAANHLEINFESQVEVLIGMGQLIGENQEYDELIDTLSDIQSKRSQDVSAANIQYSRGLQLISNKNYDGAIRHLSRSYVLYHKENTIHELVRTSGLLGKAYTEQDLLYCAKTCFCRALGLLFNRVGDEGRSDHLIVSILHELCVVELRLGQLTTFLEWLTLMDGVVALIPEYLDDDFLESRGMLDAILGSRLYETPLDRKEYSILPDILERHQLLFSRNVLLLKMGNKEDVSEDYKFLIDSEESTKKYILKMAEDVKFLFPLTLNVNKTAHLQSLAHGCKFIANYSGVTYGQTYSEMYLAFMELLMDSKAARVFPSAPEIFFEVRSGTEGENKIEQGKNSNEYIVLINKNTFASQNNVWESLINMFGHVAAGSIVVGDLDVFLKKRQEDEYFMQRISLLSAYPTDVSNFCPSARKAYLELFSKSGDKTYPFKLESERKSSISNNKQSDAIVTSLIDVKLWDAAKWKGCGYIISRDFTEPGIMVLMYENIDAGIKIFEQWAEDYEKGKLNIRIVIITGVDKKHPQWYKVLITPDVKQYLQEIKQKERYVISSSRFHLMNAVSDENIKALREAYNNFSFIGLSASLMENNQMSFEKNKRYNKVIPIRNFSFIEAWTIKENDVESVAILPSDDIIIPPGRENDAPVLKVIEKKKNYGQDI